MADLCPYFSKEHPDDAVLGQHRFEWGPDGEDPDDEDSRCVGCGAYYKDTASLWEKIETVYHTLVPYAWRPKNVWYRIKCRLWSRWTTIKPRTLGHEWCDRDGLLVHMVFEIARNFIEKEGPKNAEEWAWQKEHNPEFYASWHETKEIIDWWLTHDDDWPWDMPDEEFDKQFPWTMPPDYHGTEYEQRCYQKLLANDKHKEQIREKLKRIIDISPYYWT